MPAIAPKAALAFVVKCALMKGFASLCARTALPCGHVDVLGGWWLVLGKMDPHCEKRLLCSGKVEMQCNHQSKTGC